MSAKGAPLALVKELRERTGAGVVDCQKALTESGGDVEKAITLLREKGLAAAAKRAGRSAAQGVVGSYIHGGGKIGVLLEVNCETDFVAKNEDFVSFAKDLTLQIISMSPENVKDLLQQDFVKDPSKKVSDLLKEIIAKTGENVVVNRFVVYKVGQE